MPATAEEFLPLSELKANLRFPEVSDVSDDFIRGHRDAAVEEIARAARVPLVDEVVPVEVIHDPADTRLAIGRIEFVTEVTDIKYWMDDADRGQLPNGTVTGFGRVQYDARPGLTETQRTNSRKSTVYVWAPADGWPTSTDNAFIVSLKRTVGTEKFLNLKMAAIMSATSVFMGERTARTSKLIDDLVRGRSDLQRIYKFRADGNIALTPDG